MLRSNPRTNWIETAEMLEAIGCGRGVLSRLKRSGYFKEGEHYRRINPLAARGKLVWNAERVILKLFGG